jgi:hypothetical protein
MSESIFLKLLTFSLTFLLAKSQYNWCNMTSTNQYAGGTASHSFICTFQNFTIATTNNYFDVYYSNNWNINSFTKGNANDYCENSCTLGSVITTPTGQNIKITGLIPNA